MKKMSVEKATLCSGLDEDTLDLLSIVIKQERAREREGGINLEYEFTRCVEEIKALHAEVVAKDVMIAEQERLLRAIERKASQYEDDREYNARLVEERDARIRELKAAITGVCLHGRTFDRCHECSPNVMQQKVYAEQRAIHAESRLALLEKVAEVVARKPNKLGGHYAMWEHDLAIAIDAAKEG